MTERASCTFHVKHCTHDSIFGIKYTRYQKAQKIKVLRCFPHCCPNHVYYRYCGTPISIITTIPNLKALENYVSVLKIAPAYDQDWAIGDVISPITTEYMNSMTQTVGSTWHVGRQEFMGNNSILSSFNQELIDGWVYGWKSGRSQAVRDCLHHVKAFVFEIVNQPSVQWKVIARVFSPGFTFVSYRSLHYSNVANSLAIETPSPSNRTDTQTMQNYSGGTISPQSISSQTQLMANRLGYLMVSLKLLPLKSSGIQWQSQLIQNLFGLDIAKMICHAPLTTAFNTPSEAKETKIDMPLQLVIDWFVHLFAPHYVEQYESIILAHRECVFERKSLMSAYNDCVHVLHTISENYFKNEQGQSVSNVCKIVAAHYPATEELVQNQVAIEGFFGFHAFVAYFREVYLNSLATPFIWPQNRTELISPLCGEWIFQPTRSSLEFEQINALDAIRWTSWLFGIQCVLQPQHFCLKSKWSAYPCQPAKFELDRQPHTFRLFPNGESTLSGHGLVLDGDYIAWQTNTGEVVIECYHYELLLSSNWWISFRISSQGENLLIDLTCNMWHAQLEDDVAFWGAAQRIALWDAAKCQPFGRGSLVYSQVTK